MTFQQSQPIAGDAWGTQYFVSPGSVPITSSASSSACSLPLTNRFRNAVTCHHSLGSFQCSKHWFHPSQTSRSFHHSRIDCQCVYVLGHHSHLNSVHSNSHRFFFLVFISSNHRLWHYPGRRELRTIEMMTVDVAREKKYIRITDSSL